MIKDPKKVEFSFNITEETGLCFYFVVNQK